jgi:cytochrome c oxidase subunit 3
MVESDRGGLPPIEPDVPFGGGGDGDSGGGHGAGRSAAVLGLVVGMVASTMTFAALASTLILRHALAQDWVSLPVPRILWPNTVLLLLSSVAIELARRALRRGQRERFNRLWWMGIVLGSGFLAGQTVAWLQLRARGIYVSTNPSHGLFYVLTWTHAAHAIAALIALLWVGIAASRYRLGPGKRTGVVVSGIFWHFLDVMWLCLMALFVKWG